MFYGLTSSFSLSDGSLLLPWPNELPTNGANPAAEVIHPLDTKSGWKVDSQGNLCISMLSIFYGAIFFRQHFYYCGCFKKHQLKVIRTMCLFSCLTISSFSRENGSILYCTTGVILQWMRSNPTLSHISHIVLDGKFCHLIYRKKINEEVL